MASADVQVSVARRAFGDTHALRVATSGPDGAPHVAPAWFVWREDAVFVSLRRGSRSWLNLELDPRVSLIIDRGHAWNELSGVILEGRVELLPAEHPALRAPMSEWHQKYRSLLPGPAFEDFARAVPDLGFLRLEPALVDAWDHRV